jgi:hypothetical protein
MNLPRVLGGGKRPTIQELVPGYTAVSIPAKVAVRYIVESRLASQTARGRGNRAARRAKALSSK